MTVSETDTNKLLIETVYLLKNILARGATQKMFRSTGLGKTNLKVVLQLLG